MFFKNYPQTLYQFGTEESYSAFQNISVYVDLIDQVKDNSNFYQYYYIQDGYRPDTVSYQLYGTVRYYWTLFYLNDKLREQGWPLSAQEIRLKTIEDYPSIVLTTRNIETLYQHFQIGNTVSGQSSGATGTIIKRNLQLGQIFVSHNHGTSQEFTSNELIRDDINPEFPQQVQLVSAAEGAAAIHHYVDANGVITDVDPYNAPSVLLTPVTYLERAQAANDEIKTIKIIKPGSIEQIFKAYKDSLRSV
tara:strand:+ start:257 stop:1000 length:744 start_codon:yes stop_codon:yes gene_type:complete